jgi:carboxyl-terminal processing protease
MLALSLDVRKKQRHLLAPPALALTALVACVAQGGMPFPGQRGGTWSGGIGAVLRYGATARTLTVHEAPSEGAAARAGLRAGDRVLAIDGATVSEMDEREIIARLRGEVGTVVSLRVLRDGVLRDVRVERSPYRRRERD